MKPALLAMAIMVTTVLLGWFVQGVQHRKGQDCPSQHDGSISADAAGSSHGWFDGHRYSGDHVAPAMLVEAAAATAVVAGAIEGRDRLPSPVGLRNSLPDFRFIPVWAAYQFGIT